MISEKTCPLQWVLLQIFDCCRHFSRSGKFERPYLFYLFTVSLFTYLNAGIPVKLSYLFNTVSWTCFHVQCKMYSSLISTDPNAHGIHDKETSWNASGNHRKSDVLSSPGEVSRLFVCLPLFVCILSSLETWESNGCFSAADSTHVHRGQLLFFLKHFWYSVSILLLSYMDEKAAVCALNAHCCVVFNSFNWTARYSLYFAHIKTTMFDKYK